MGQLLINHWKIFYVEVKLNVIIGKETVEFLEQSKLV